MLPQILLHSTYGPSEFFAIGVEGYQMPDLKMKLAWDPLLISVCLLWLLRNEAWELQ